MFSKGNNQPVATADDCNTGLTRRIDGSVCYDSASRIATLDEVDEKAKVYMQNEIFGIEKFHQLSPAYIRLLDLFINELKKEHIEVILYLSPYHPLVYQKIKNSIKYRSVIDAEIFYRQVAQKYACEIIGSYDPGKQFPDGSLFFDGMHLREKGVRLILQQINLSKN